MKLLSCFFLDDVLCSFRRSEKFGMMDRCESCEHYKRFNREMAEEEDKFFDGVDRAEKLRERYMKGEISEEEFRKGFLSLDWE